MKNPGQLLHIRDKECLKAGGKAAGLHKLTLASLNVPDAYVLTGNSDNHERRLIHRAWEALDSEALAARSSASDEDGTVHSAAGQYESFLKIRSEEELVKAVELCKASLHSGRASRYRETGGGKRGEPRMSVVIQKMISPRFAGVLFTVDPLKGSGDEMVLESIRGEGEELVGGSRAAARIYLNRKGEILRIDSPGSGEHPPADQIQRMAEEALRYEGDEESPQDMEWCIDHEGILHWLQARPVTATELPGAEEFDYEPQSDDEIFTRCNIGEMIPGAVTPLTRDCFATSIEYAMRVLYRSSGGIHKGNRDRPFVVSFSNHLIFNFTSIYGMAGRIAGAGKENIEMNILGRTIDDPLPHPPASRILQILNALKYFSTMGRHRVYLKRLERLSVRFSRSEDPGQALEEWIGKLPVMDRGYALHMLVSGHSGFANSLLGHVLERANPALEVNDSLLSQLLSRVEGVESAQAVEDLERICREIRKSAETEALFLEAEDKSLMEWLEEASDPAASLYRGFMKRHGHRCIREAEFRSRGWEEEPEQILSNIKGMLRLKERGGIKEGASPFPLETFLKQFTGRSAEKSVAWALKKSRLAVRERELSKSLSIRIQYCFKKEIRRIAALMCRNGLLPDEDLIYFFTKEELRDLTTGGEQHSPLIRRAVVRRRLLQEQSLVELPEIWRGRVPELPRREDEEDVTLIRGTPVSMGRIRGRVRIVKTADDAGRLKEGEIMVAPLTDIGWTPFYSIAGGMITEIGSALSHGSVIAREYGLPLVTNINGATRLLAEGTEIEIDGREGTVRILDAV